MGFFGNGEPKWYRVLQQQFKPINNDIIFGLDAYKNGAQLSNKQFAMVIMLTPWAVQKLQWSIYSQAKLEYPIYSEKKNWKLVFHSRLKVKLSTAEMPNDQWAKPLTIEEIEELYDQTDEILDEFETFTELVDFIVEVDKKENRFYDPTGMIEEVDRTLHGLL